MFRANYKNYRIAATYTGEKAAPWGNGQENWNHHRITVTNTETGKRTTFDFWASIAHPVLDSTYDVLNAFYCFVSDAVSGMESFTEFCSNFGYDNDSITALKTWRACKRSYDKLSRIYDGDLYDLINELSEEYA